MTLTRARTLATYAPLLAAGPVTGPLIALGLTCARRRQWVRAALCLTAIPLFWLVLAALELHLINSGRPS